MDWRLARLFQTLNCNVRRRIKLRTTFGPQFTPYNALGQGDPLVLVVALMYVSVQFNALQARFSTLRFSGVVDDRNLRGDRSNVESAIRFIMQYDEAAGHETHPKKMALAATTTEGRLWCSQLRFNGMAPNVLHQMVLVGDLVTTTRSGVGSLANRRAAHAMRGLQKIERCPAKLQAKWFAAQGLVIPRLVASSIWSRPNGDHLRALRSGSCVPS